jgi:nitrate reductase delta subunit
MEMKMNSMLDKKETEVREAFQLMSYLLQYPEKEWLQWRELVEETEQFEELSLRNPLLSFLKGIGKVSLDDLTQQYVQQFDFNPKCSLYLTYLKAGEKRERGQILVELKGLYKEHGLVMTDQELSDYLPLVLEFVSVAPLQISVNLFASFKEPIEKLKKELEQVGSPYSQLIEACLNGVVLLENIILLREMK